MSKDDFDAELEAAGFTVKKEKGTLLIFGGKKLAAAAEKLVEKK